MVRSTDTFDVLIIGGSYAGLSAGMALARAMRKVLIIDSGKPCNRHTPHSHNFITHDGSVPADIAKVARKQVANYPTVSFYDGVALKGTKDREGFVIATENNDTFYAAKLIFASGIRDMLPAIPGLQECWGKTVIHCPYCHGYEVRNKKTGILGNGDYAFDFSKLISNWTDDLSLFTNGKPTLTADQLQKIRSRHINIVEKEIVAVDQRDGKIASLVFGDGTNAALQALYTKPAFEQHCVIPAQLGCELTETGHIKVDAFQKTNVPGIYACGDNSHPMRTVSVATAAGTLAGVMANKDFIEERF